jgi:diacylglycerol kinase family enzyme
MRKLSWDAGHSAAWLVLAAALWATGDRWARRAAWRGLGSMLAARVATSLLGHALAADPGGAAAGGPAARQLRWLPLATRPPAWPAAAGAAFATGARLMTLRWWPRRPLRPAAAMRPPRAAPAAPTGEGVVLLVNTRAGTASAELAKLLAAELPEATIIKTRAGLDLAVQLRRAAQQARILGVAGGDGTISTAAAIALELGLPLLVIPAGTYNHFAADLGIRSARDAIAALRAGRAVLVDVGIAGRRSFVNTSSTGVYVDLVLAREQIEGTLGRRAAAIVSLIQVLRHSRPHELILDGQHRRLWLYFAGNCRYEPAGMAPTYRPDLSDGWLDIRIVEARRLARARLVAAAATGTLGRSRVYHAWRARSTDIRATGGGPVWLSVDGEVATAETGFTQSKHERGLLVYRRSGT